MKALGHYVETKTHLITMFMLSFDCYRKRILCLCIFKNDYIQVLEKKVIKVTKILFLILAQYSFQTLSRCIWVLTCQALSRGRDLLFKGLLLKKYNKQISFSMALGYCKAGNIYKIQSVEKKRVFLGINHFYVKTGPLPFSSHKPNQEDHERAQNPTGQCTSPILAGANSLWAFHHRELMLKSRANWKQFHSEYENICYFMGLSGQDG